MFFPGQTEEKRKVYLKWTSIVLSSKLFLTCGGNDNYYKSVHHPIPTLPVGIENNLTIFEKNQQALLSVECPGIFSSWPNWRGEDFLEGTRRGAALWNHSQVHLVVIKDKKSLSFCELLNNPTPFLLLIRPPYR